MTHQTNFDIVHSDIDLLMTELVTERLLKELNVYWIIGTAITVCQPSQTKPLHINNFLNIAVTFDTLLNKWNE